MKNFKYSFAAKLTAFFLFSISSLAFFGGLASIVYMGDNGIYNTDGVSYYNSRLCTDIIRKEAADVYYGYFKSSQVTNQSTESAFALKQYQTHYSKQNSNFFFTVTDGSGKVLLSNHEEQEYGIQRTYQFDEEGASYFVNGYVKSPISAKDDFYSSNQLFLTLYSLRYIIIAIAALSAIIALVMFIFLLCSSGHRKGKEGIVLNRLDKIPLDLVAVCLFALAGLTVNLYSNNHPDGIWGIAPLCVAMLIVAVLVATLCISFAARLKAGEWYKNTVIYRVLKLIYKLLRAVAKHIGLLFANLPLLWKTILIFAGYLFINGLLVLIFTGAHGEPVSFFLGLLFNLAALTGLCYLTLQLRQLKLGGEKIADGDIHYKIDTAKMLWELKTHGENLNNIVRGLSKAVEAQLKSERFKTELITNVSHDIKTPLTSIMNYVDLLKKENIENEKAAEYIEVLDRQSARLKKLTEDLVEASKVVSGNIAVYPVCTNAVELLNQSMGEYAERFAASGLEAIVHVPQTEVVLLADGKLLWRVFDNLLNNICKYSQPNTRVYLDVSKASGKVVITFKNISKYPLNVSADELQERFVRGDSSRSTEGSGLGLSIAKGLTELQKGHFDISVDGDLFKAIISFNSID